MTIKWDMRFLRLAAEVSTWSKDPSTKVGAIIVRPDKTVASLGYNGFPRLMSDHQTWLDERDSKYERIVHAEMNAILHASERLHGFTLYTYPFLPCPRCAVHVAQAGITRVVSQGLPRQPEERWARWEPELVRTRRMFNEMYVSVMEYGDAS